MLVFLLPWRRRRQGRRLLLRLLLRLGDWRRGRHPFLVHYDLLLWRLPVNRGDAEPKSQRKVIRWWIPH